MSGPYRVVVASRAAKDLRRLRHDERAAIIAALERLAAMPRAGKPLVGQLAGIWSLRRGDYRVLYRVDDASKIVEVARVAHRRDVYRRGVNG
ncbi:MAG: type II toxin-antitoxin system RelE/ParE family toxin [Chloroflexi bacterium]|nr:MAG: type II toxin-antitoxin system RelE/ParE family toxin [Chloroflexota bacterium]